MKRGRKILLVLLMIVIIVMLAILGFIVFAHGDSKVIGENDLGKVTKINYTHYDDSQVKIAIVSGMHPREKLHSFVLPYVCWYFSLWNNVEIVNYRVDVTKDSDVFAKSRANGESLVHDYVVSDVNDSDLDLVIIGHDHEPGYGEGYYIATPSMDNESVELAQDVTKDIGFRHYTRNKNQSTQSTSIANVDNPIVDTGTMVFVYEIPEVDGKWSAFEHSYELLESSFKHLSNN